MAHCLMLSDAIKLGCVQKKTEVLVGGKQTDYSRLGLNSNIGFK